MEDNLKYIVYLTINIKNSKIYVGVHGTKTPYEFDGYIGEGVFISRPSTYKRPKYPFHHAVKKYGPKNFKRLTLYVCDTLQEALELEAKIVNEEFIKRRILYKNFKSNAVARQIVFTRRVLLVKEFSGIYIREHKRMLCNSQ